MDTPPAAGRRPLSREHLAIAARAPQRLAARIPMTMPATATTPIALYG